MSSIADLKFLKRVVKDAELALFDEKQKFVDEHSRLKIGDTVKVTGWSHVGKDMVVEEIRFGEYGILATGTVLKKDGSQGRFKGAHLEMKVDIG